MKAYLCARCRSVLPAIKGARYLLASQPNAQIHAVITGTVVIAGLWTGLNRSEWLLIAIATSFVWMAEAFNTALEQLADEVSLERRTRIGRAKDLAALAVLVSALLAVIVGLGVFLPHWWKPLR